jgi:hypothetical protein
MIKGAYLENCVKLLSCSSSGNEMQEKCLRYDSKTVNECVRYTLLGDSHSKC